MMDVYADLHIHIGRTESGKPVKITGSKILTIRNILQFASSRKGLGMIGIIDCQSPEVLIEIEELVQLGKLVELDGGGLRFRETTLLLGSEIEVYDQQCHGPIHVLTYFPTLEKMKAFSDWMSHHVKNINLSTQRIYIDGKALQKKVYEFEGLFIPAHVFTPFKSLYGKGISQSLEEVFDPQLIDAIELGLSSDTNMVSEIVEIKKYPFLTNSDAHSLGKIAREYQKLKLQEATFSEFKKALRNEDGREISANYGLNPLLGKYYQTVCAHCSTPIADTLTACPNCKSEVFIKGVSTRIKELSTKDTPKVVRPPYIHQVPLEFIPKLGPKTLDRLIHTFGTEMNVIQQVTEEQLANVVSPKLARLICRARRGDLFISNGGGGKYGKVIDEA